MKAPIRHVVFGELAVAAAAANNFFYAAAIRMNKLQGWAVRHRDSRPVGSGR
jgi:hypothetical protein